MIWHGLLKWWVVPIYNWLWGNRAEAQFQENMHAKWGRPSVAQREELLVTVDTRTPEERAEQEWADYRARYPRGC